MNILAIYVSENFRTGGQRRYLELLIGLAERNYRIHLFHRKERQFPFDTPRNIILHPLTVHDGYSQQKVFTKALKNIPRNELHSLNAQNILLFGDSSLLCGIYLKRILHIPLLIAIRNNIFIADKAARDICWRNLPVDLRNRFREYQLCRYADMLFFQTSYDRDSICERNSYPIRKTSVIPNSIQAGWFLPEWRDTNSSHQLLNLIFIGSDHKRKGWDILQKALKTLKEIGRDFTLTLVGDFLRTDTTCLPDWVRFEGRLDNPLEALAKADLLIVPSLYDSFPNTVLESLFVGTPVIGTDVAGIKAMLEHESLLFPADSAAGIVKTLEPLFDRENYQQVKKLCRARLSLFDFDWIDPWEEILEKII